MNFAAMRRHLMLGIVERLARTPARADFVLRGGLLTSLWIAPRPRPTRDLDFVGDYPHDVEGTYHRFVPVLAIELADELVIARDSLRATPLWPGSAFPGVRLAFELGLRAVDQQLTIDIGFGDPLVPAAGEWPLGDTTIRAVRPETQLAWKLHALAEMTTSWRPKDLADAHLIIQHVPLADADLVPAIEAAFRSRGFARATATELFAAEHWATKTSRLRWDKKEPSLAETIAAVQARLAPVLHDLPSW